MISEWANRSSNNDRLGGCYMTGENTPVTGKPVMRSILAIKSDSSGYRLFVWGAYQGTFETIYGAIEHAIQTIGKE